MKDTDENRLLCFGLGYSARPLVNRLLEAGWEVVATRRRWEADDPPIARGVVPINFDGTGPILAPEVRLEGITHLLSSIPPGMAGDPVLDHCQDLLRSMSSLRWVGYLSSTGVYGDSKGAWVDEGSEPRPSGDTGRRRLAAEHAWTNAAERLGLPVHLFRLAGIYGPGRSVLDRIMAGHRAPIVKPGSVFSRVHVEDIVQVLEASMRAPNPGAVYNVCDDEPSPADEVLSYGCELLGIQPAPAIPFDQARLSPMAHNFYKDNRRVRNQRIKDELGITLRYPNYRLGLKAVLEVSMGRIPAS